MLVADIDSLRVEYANRSLEDTLGYAPGELIGCPISSLYPDDDGAAAFHGAVADARQGGTVGFRSEQIFTRKDGDRTWTEMTTRLLPADRPEKLVWMLRRVR